MKMIVVKTLCKESVVETTVVAYSNDYIFRRVDISRTNNQCIMHVMNVLYKNVVDLKKASVYGMW